MHLVFKSVKARVTTAYVVLALLIMGPMLGSGFVLALDMVFTPKLPVAHGMSNTWLFEWVLHLVNFLLPGQVIEKLLIFIILFICGLGMHRLIETESSWPKYFGGLFYTINPFTYERWLAGQYLIVAGYALLPWLVKSLINFVNHPSNRTAAVLALWYSLLAMLSIHIFVMAVLIGIIFIVIFSIGRVSELSYRKKLLKWSGLALIATLFINSFWLIGVIRGTSSISQTINSIGPHDLAAYTTTPNPHVGLITNVLSGYGFWLERYNRFHMPNGNIIIWLSLFALLFILVCVGAVTQFSKRKPQEKKKVATSARLVTICILVASIIGFIIACGIHAPLFGGLTKWGIEHIPLMKGFREPEKWSALLMLAYAYFGAHGLAWLLDRFAVANRQSLKQSTTSWRQTIIVLSLLLPLAYVPSMVYGFAGQLRPVHYPASWYSFNQYLKRHPPSGKALFLPWHEYMSYDFSPRVIANPAPDFFKYANIISGTDAEIGGIPNEPSTTTSKFINSQILAKTDRADLAQSLNKLHIQYVLLSGGYDAESYEWLSSQHDLQLQSHQTGLDVYKNEAYHE